jgi:1-deoxy-D-xylulose-5-phosphate reductoisomerase
LRKRVVILGSTGSVGLQALDVVRQHPDRFEVLALSANSSAKVLRRQATEFGAPYVALERGDPSALRELDGVEVLTGAGSAARLAGLSEADVVLNAILGFAGLAATVAALEAGNALALANKESLIAGGEWVKGLPGADRILPVDSEHSAIFQCLQGRREGEVREVLLTASGGPFYERSEEELRWVTAQDALRHPTWKMGPKITIDSATMMNKGLEVIEAHHLFGIPYDRVKVVVHRQSIVHGGVIFEDGAALLHAATPDMRLPIAYALLHPERVDVEAESIPFGGVSWTFDEPRDAVFRCLPLAVEAGKRGGAYPVALNAANEVAVEAFLEGRIEFLRIAEAVEEVLEAVPDLGEMNSMEAIVDADRWARAEAAEWVAAL